MGFKIQKLFWEKLLLCWRGDTIGVSESAYEKIVPSFVFLRYDRYRLFPKIPRNNGLTVKASWVYNICQNKCWLVPDMSIWYFGHDRCNSIPSCFPLMLRPRQFSSNPLWKAQKYKQGHLQFIIVVLSKQKWVIYNLWTSFYQVHETSTVEMTVITESKQNSTTKRCQISHEKWVPIPQRRSLTRLYGYFEAFTNCYLSTRKTGS